MTKSRGKKTKKKKKANILRNLRRKSPNFSREYEKIWIENAKKKDLRSFSLPLKKNKRFSLSLWDRKRLAYSLQWGGRNNKNSSNTLSHNDGFIMLLLLIMFGPRFLSFYFWLFFYLFLFIPFLSFVFTVLIFLKTFKQIIIGWHKN